ncbi:hypothetical protein D9623_33445 (plasmid) [Azospirillum brasilense]|uniref:Uncharacterized protein n=2 Tax=root TaxID=1 RepID=A0A4D8QTE9_AZOBR|nr:MULTISPECIES: hypothetical protein [Azospirillum]MDW7555342.1 hypothetical protein [Azospirillum brasilense]MDW7595250.1 hypothetical protein [Azospirillum brasilense]MDW7630404.1 hypothetical protein [Azospirillum brasilense]MDX5949771.1 hypothetical protein [Azospirillum brasilense]QCO12811.1 hypothetical protein D3868_27775 [Azospirillum brasilense]
MAMTKAEKAEMEALREARDLARALRWPEYAEPAMIPPPDFSGSHTSGWLFNTYRLTAQLGGMGDAVYRAWSESTTHGDGQSPIPHRSATQGGVHLFATRLDALKALRLAVTEEFARKLARVDAEIAAESAKAD